MFRRAVVALVALLACGVGLQGAGHAANLARCLHDGTGRARQDNLQHDVPPLSWRGSRWQHGARAQGDRFQTSWGGDVVESLFTKVRDTMPPNFGTILDDQVKLDIVTYILQTNGFPAGSSDLLVGSADLATTQILKKGEQAAVQNFSLIQTVGCLATGPNNTWMLTRTAEPLTTRDDVPSDRGLASAASRPLGTKTFRLISVAPFKPESHTGQKVEARGLIYTEPGDERINLTSLKPTGGNCS